MSLLPICDVARHVKTRGYKTFVLFPFVPSFFPGLDWAWVEFALFMFFYSWGATNIRQPFPMVGGCMGWCAWYLACAVFYFPTAIPFNYVTFQVMGLLFFFVLFMDQIELFGNSSNYHPPVPPTCTHYHHPTWLGTCVITHRQVELPDGPGNITLLDLPTHGWPYATHWVRQWWANI